MVLPTVAPITLQLTVYLVTVFYAASAAHCILGHFVLRSFSSYKSAANRILERLSCREAINARAPSHRQAYIAALAADGAILVSLCSLQWVGRGGVAGRESEGGIKGQHAKE